MTLPEAERGGRRGGEKGRGSWALTRTPAPVTSAAPSGLWRTPPAIEEFQRPRAGIALRRRSSGFRSALGKFAIELRRACGTSVDSWGVVHELSIGGHVRN